jgi:hypothetical protein
VAILMAAMMFSGIASGQNQTGGDSPNAPPRLHQRTEPTYGDVRSPVNPQVIEIILDGNGLTGYISMLGKTEKDKDAALTYFFDETELDAKTLSFTTRPVHGQSYSFEGTIVRGPATSREKDGYYLLQGTLTLHSDGTGGGDQPRRVTLPLARSIDG